MKQLPYPPVCATYLFNWVHLACMGCGCVSLISGQFVLMGCNDPGPTSWCDRSDPFSWSGGTVLFSWCSRWNQSAFARSFAFPHNVSTSSGEMDARKQNQERVLQRKLLKCQWRQISPFFSIKRLCQNNLLWRVRLMLLWRALLISPQTERIDGRYVFRVRSARMLG